MAQEISEILKLLNEKLAGLFPYRLELVGPGELKLLDKNARYMKAEQFQSLVENVRKDGNLSSDQRVDTPISLYAATKKADELMAHAYTHLYGLQTVGLRFFTVYGPWGRPDMAMWLFSEAMLQGRPIKVFNYGRMRRDFTYIDDIVSGVLAALTATGLEPYEIINLGNHRAEDLGKVIALIERELKVKAQQDLLPIQPGDIPATFADIDKARAKLGFKPLTPIDQGITRFVKWYPEYHGQANFLRGEVVIMPGSQEIMDS